MAPVFPSGNPDPNRLGTIAWADVGMLLIEQQNIPKESIIFVLLLVKAARRALLSATGYRADKALEVLDQWLGGCPEVPPNSGQPQNNLSTTQGGAGGG